MTVYAEIDRMYNVYVSGSDFEIWAKMVKTVSLVELCFFRLKHAVVITESRYIYINFVTGKGYRSGYHSALKATVAIMAAIDRAT